MHITLIKPAMAMPLDSFTTQSGVPPIGIAYIAGYLKSKNYNVKIIDSIGENLNNIFKIPDIDLIVTGLSFLDIISKIPKNTDIIGLSVMFSNEWPVCRKLIELIKNEFKDISIVCGGEAATADALYIMDTTPELDFLIEGEGEDKLYQLLKELEGDQNYKSVPGLIWRTDNNNYNINGNNNRILNIDDLPWPDWSDIPIENYLSSGLGQSTYNRRVMPILASRGCPYQCTFCTNLNMYGTSWYCRPAKDVIKEISYYIETYNIQHFDFCDLTIIVNKQWILEFCKELIKHNFDITWALPSGTRSEVIDEEVLTYLKNSGLERMNYAPESGSQTTLRNIKKDINLDKMNESMRIALKVKLKVKATLIFGFPDQDKEQVYSNIKYIIKLAVLGIHDVACFPFVPYPGSELHSQLHRNGKIDKSSKEYEMWLTTNIFNKVKGMKSYSQYISNKQLQLLVLGGMSLFYSLQFLIRPWRIVSVIYRLISKTPITMLENLIYQAAKSFLIAKKQRIAARNNFDN